MKLLSDGCICDGCANTIVKRVVAGVESEFECRIRHSIERKQRQLIRDFKTDNVTIRLQIEECIGYEDCRD